MFNMKKFLATSLALSMVVGASALPSQAVTKAEQEYGVEYQLSTKNYSTNSMEANAYNNGAANTFTASFHPDAEVEVDDDGETFTLTIYIANDENITFFSGSKTTGALFVSCEVKYNGNAYPGVILASYDNASAPQKVFNRTPSNATFVKMTAGETYGCDVITVSGIPVEALEDDGLQFDYTSSEEFGYTVSLNQKLETGIVLDYEEVSNDETPSDQTPSDETPEYDVEKSQSMDFGVQVDNTNDPTYTVTIPTSFDLTPSDDGGVNENYTVEFVMDGYASVTISAESDGVLKADGTEDTLAYTNTFTEQKHTGESGSQMGNISIDADAMKAVESGNYKGTIDFHFGFSTEDADSE